MNKRKLRRSTRPRKGMTDDDYDDEEMRWQAIEEDLFSSGNVANCEKPENKREPDGIVIFQEYYYECLHTEDQITASIESLVGGTGVLDIPFLQVFILRQPAPIRHEMCQYLFILMSLTHDKELLFAMRKCTPLYDLGWRPDFKDLLIVFANWGAPIHWMFNETAKSNPCQPDPVITSGNTTITSDNIKLVLHHMESGLPHAMQGGEAVIDILARTVFKLSLENIFITTFTRRYMLHCFSTLVEHIPDSLWDQDKVWQLSDLAIAGFEDYIHNLAVICKKLFMLCDRCETFGLHLAYRIIYHCLQTVEQKKEVAIVELPVTVSHIVNLILSKTRRSKDMDMFFFDIMVDLMCTVMLKNPPSVDEKQKVVKYLEYMLSVIHENYESNDVTKVRQKIRRFSNLLN